MEANTTFSGIAGHVGDPIRLGIITVSDRAESRRICRRRGLAILGFSKRPSRARGRPSIGVCRMNALPLKPLSSNSSAEGCHVVVTTGGAGPAQRDITPEATEAVCDRMMPGLANKCEAFPSPSYQRPFSPDRWVDCAGNRCSSTSQADQKPSGKPSMKFGGRCPIVLI